MSKMYKNGILHEVTCDICSSVFDNEIEIDEFMFFDYVMGENSLYPLKRVVFDVCQDCFTSAFQEMFD